MGWMMFGGTLWLLIIIAVVWFALRTMNRGGAGSEDSPETILKRRYARGEMEREDYERRLTDLRR